MQITVVAVNKLIDVTKPETYLPTTNTGPLASVEGPLSGQTSQFFYTHHPNSYPLILQERRHPACFLGRYAAMDGCHPGSNRQDACAPPGLETKTHPG